MLSNILFLRSHHSLVKGLVMHTDLATFLDVVYKHTPSTAYMVLTTIKPMQVINTSYHYSNERDHLIHEIERLGDTTNIYLRIAPTRMAPAYGKRGIESDSIGASVLWVDLDCYDPIQKTAALDALYAFSSPPTLVVDSGGGLHAYWLLDSFSDDLPAIKARNKWLYQQFSDNAADTIFDLARVLRVPSSYNVKQKVPRLVSIVRYTSELVYKLSDFSAASLEDEQPIIVWDHTPISGGFAVAIKERDRTLFNYMTDLYKATKMFVTSNGGFDRSENAFYCACKLFELGYAPEQCMSVLMDNRFLPGKKYNDTGRMDFVTATVNAAYRKFLTSTARYFEKSRFQAKIMGTSIVGDQQQYIYTADNFWRYESGRYIRNAETVIKAEVVKRLGTRWSKHCEDETLGYVQSAYYVPIQECNQRSNEYINCANGMLNITTGAIELHDQAYKSLYQLPAHYDKNVDTTVVDWFVESIIPKDAIAFFWEYVGSALLTSHYWPKAFLLLVGAGDSGKSTMLRFIRAILGDDNCSKLTLQALADNRFAIVKLYGKLANIFADLSETEVGDVGQIKAITGDDAVYGEEKFEKGFDFTNVARLIFSANHYPTIKNADQAFFNRAKLVRCGNHYSGKKADEALSQRLALPENLSAALLRMYQGVQRLLVNKEFTYSASMQVELLAYQAYADSVYGFLEQCRYAPEYRVNKQELYNSYVEICKAANRSKVTANSFYRRLMDQAAKRGISESRPEINGERERVYCGIKAPTDVTTFYIPKAIGVN